MNAETTMFLADGRQYPDSQSPLSLQLARIRRALGFTREAKPLAKPQVQHPLEMLAFHNGTLRQLHNSLVGAEYMPLSGVEVVKKHSLRELKDERCEYRFELNLEIDSIWRLYLDKLLPDAAVRFEGNVLVLTCLPAELEWNYQRTKQGIEQANMWYAEERECLISEVVAREEEREAVREMEQNRKAGLRRQFEQLEL